MPARPTPQRWTLPVHGNDQSRCNGLEIKEGSTKVDIGYHYVATDQYGNPIDTNSDGIPDYLSDANGNGVVDSGESVGTYPAISASKCSSPGPKTIRSYPNPQPALSMNL